MIRQKRSFPATKRKVPHPPSPHNPQNKTVSYRTVHTGPYPFSDKPAEEMVSPAVLRETTNRVREQKSDTPFSQGKDSKSKVKKSREIRNICTSVPSRRRLLPAPSPPASFRRCPAHGAGKRRL